MKNMKRLFFPLAALLACLAAVAASAQTYSIQRGDRLSIQVLEDPGLNSQVLVRPDGQISLPIVGAVQAEGVSPEQLSQQLSAALAANFRQPPNVTVSLLSVGGGELLLGEELVPQIVVYVIGEVGRPGAIEVPEGASVLQALAAAGGLGRFAAERRIQIRSRTEEGQEVIRTFDYDAITEGGPIETPITLTNGDIIVAPERNLFE